MKNKNSLLALEYLTKQTPTDEITLDEKGVEALQEMRNEIVGDDINLVADVVWSQTVPLMDFIVDLSGRKMRYCFFEDAIDNIHKMNFKEGDNPLLVGAVQELKHNSYWLFGALHGNYGMTFSNEYYDETGDGHPTVLTQESLAYLLRLWHSIQLALLHPKAKEIMPKPKVVKQHEKRKNTEGKRERVTYYIKRYAVDGEQVRKSMKEINRKCKAWYVIGHWRNLKNGKITYVRGYWKGEMRALKRNLDDGRERIIKS